MHPSNLFLLPRPLSLFVQRQHFYGRVNIRTIRSKIPRMYILSFNSGLRRISLLLTAFSVFAIDIDNTVLHARSSRRDRSNVLADCFLQFLLRSTMINDTVDNDGRCIRTTFFRSRRNFANRNFIRRSKESKDS